LQIEEIHEPGSPRNSKRFKKGILPRIGRKGEAEEWQKDGGQKDEEGNHERHEKHEIGGMVLAARSAKNTKERHEFQPRMNTDGHGLGTDFEQEAAEKAQGMGMAKRWGGQKDEQGNHERLSAA
jgi:hypothetical protein